jgi:hypothetical protein
MEHRIDLLAIGRISPVQRLVQPPAIIPYARPNNTSPTNLYAKTPHRTKMVIDAELSKERPSSHGLNMSERYPIDNLPTTEAPGRS